MIPLFTRACLRIETRSSCELLERLIESATPRGEAAAWMELPRT